MKKILVTGATGNVGSALLKQLHGEYIELWAGVRNVNKAQIQLPFHEDSNIRFCALDFEKHIYPEQAFSAIFLVRPPQLAKLHIFESFLEPISRQTKIVFLSVQGADKKAYLPHAKIEKLIRSKGFGHVFIRPGYFMENLLTTLWEELKNNYRIFLPAANLKLNWVAIADIAEVAQKALLEDIDLESIEILNQSYHSFSDVIREINHICKTRFAYESPSVLRYFAYMLRQGKPTPFILVMLLLHYLPRFNYEPPVFSNDFMHLMQKQPTSLTEFVKTHQAVFENI